MKKGIYVGHHGRTGAALFLTPDGMMRGTFLTRLPVQERLSNDFLDVCKGVPSEVKPRRRAALGAVNTGVEEGAATRNEVNTRRRYITIAEVERDAGPDACPACTRMASGERGQRGARGAHSDECRGRFDALWSSDVSDEAITK